MNPVHAEPFQRAYWMERDGCENHARVIGGPAEGPDVIPCPALIAPGVNVVHVAYQVDEIELATLARGGTLWLTTWGGLPIHLVEVVAPGEAAVAGPGHVVDVPVSASEPNPLANRGTR